ncbi:MAG: hypothetical protein OIF57_02350 [Marinobacterium sp.]|nr:hypothetical protein [Marinobacterium sp.]
MKIKADLGVLDILVHLLIWLALSFITLGLAMFVYPYYFARFVLNRTTITDDHGRERQLECQVDLMGSLVHIIIWALISLLTFGVGYIFYFYKVWAYSLNNSRLV